MTGYAGLAGPPRSSTQTGAGFALKGALWLLVYVTLALLPIGLLLVVPRPPGRGFLRELSVGLAFAGAALLFALLQSGWG